MAKLGYTWYPKDWGNSDAVFELNLTERGLYRELIDMAMLNDNKTIVNYKVWQRKFDIDFDGLEPILNHLHDLGLIEFKEQDNNEDLPDIIFLPSCESRLKLVRGGSKGGSKSKPTPKPTSKPTPKPTSNQIEKKEKGKEKEIKENSFTLFWQLYPNKAAKQKAKDKWMKLTVGEIKLIGGSIRKFIDYKPFPEYTHPHPTTYLNNRRWEDEIPTSEQQGGVSIGSKEKVDADNEAARRIKEGYNSVTAINQPK